MVPFRPSIIDNNPKPLIAVDFDKTLCDSNYPEFGPAIAGGREALQRFRDLGFLILIYSCRTCHWHYGVFGGSPETPTLEREHVIKMREWLIEHQIPFDEIDDGSRGKPYAALYVDDKGFRFENNWPAVASWVEENLAT